MTFFTAKKQAKKIPTQKLAEMKDKLEKYNLALREQVQKKQKKRDLQEENVKKMEDDKKIKTIKKTLL